MSYGYKNDKICNECKFDNSERCIVCYHHMNFIRKKELIDKLNIKGN